MVSRAPQLEPIRSSLNRIKKRCDYAGELRGTMPGMIIRAVNDGINVPIFYGVSRMAEAWSEHEPYRKHH